MKREPRQTETEAIDEESDRKDSGCDENAEAGTNILELLNFDTRESRIHGIVIGNLVGIEHSGAPLVDFPGNASNRYLIARSTVNLSIDQVGREVVLMFEKGDPNKPVVMGLVRMPVENQPNEIARDKRRIEIDIKRKRLVFKADKEIVLQCGKASITLTRVGKVLIRGAYLLSRSSGVNRIKGGSVQLN